MPDGETAQTNSSTRHVLEAMKLIAQSAEPLGLADIAAAMDLPTSTAHRALMTLEESGYAHRAGRGASFVAGDVVHHLIRSMAAQFPARHLLAADMRELSEALDLTVSLNWRVGWQSIRLLSVESTRESYQLRRVGEARPLHSGIGPLAILAGLGVAGVEGYLADWESNPVPIAKPPEAAPLLDWVSELDRMGYIRRNPSDYSALVWIALPLWNAEGTAQGSISVGFSPTLGDAPDEADQIANALDRVARMQDRLDAAGERAVSPFDHLSPEHARIGDLRLQLGGPPAS